MRRPLLVSLLIASAGGVFIAANALASPSPALPNARSAHVVRSAGALATVGNKRTGVRGVNVSLRAHFLIFRRPASRSHAAGAQTAPPGLPSNPAIQSRYGLDLSQTQVLDLPAGGEVFVVPGLAGACIVLTTAPIPSGPLAGASGRRGNCGSTADLLHGLISVGGFNGTDSVLGLLPDGNSAVNLQLGATHAQTDVTDNVLFVTIPQGSVAFTFKNASGGQQSFSYNDATPAGR